MCIRRKDIRVRSPIEAGQWLSVCLLIQLGSITTAETAGAQKQNASSAGLSPLTTEEVVERLVGMNLRRAQALHSYQGTRSHRAEYKSPLKTLRAEMVVEVKYRAPATKEFTIKSSSGSTLIIDKVFRKILQAEEDALTKETQQSTALSGENYLFTMVGYEDAPLRSTFILAVEPKTRSKYLFHGRIWVDGDDFAVSRIEAEPAKNPSFWTVRNEISQSYMKIDDFWLPERNNSNSAIRIGGHAELTIDYQNYKITAADPVGDGPTREAAQSLISPRPLKAAGLRQSLSALPVSSPNVKVSPSSLESDNP
jgi:hypothetical protein